MTVTLDQMKEKLLTLDAAEAILKKTEPLATDLINSDTKIKFTFGPEWHNGLDVTEPTKTLEGVAVRINGQERQMTKEAVLSVAKDAHINEKFLRETPPNIVTEVLDWHWGAGMGNRAVNFLSVNNVVSASTRASVTPYSNVELLHHAAEGIAEHYGSDTDILVDYKINHSLNGTDVRLIIPEHSRTIQHTNLPDVPSAQEDFWLAGVSMTNAITGKKQTAIEAYLFRYWCTNGAITRMPDMGIWRRNAAGTEESEVYEWARNSVDEVLGGLEEQFDQVQALAHLTIAGNTSDILRELFKRYNVPVTQRDQIMANLLEMESLSMYAVMNAITSIANDANLEPARVERLMRIGGDIPTNQIDTIKAKIWREGHLANPQETNPYEVHVIA